MNGRWDAQILVTVLSPELILAILQHPALTGRAINEVIWMPTKSGRFSLSSAFHEVRQARHTSFVYSNIWKPDIPLKVSFFKLRLLMGRLPLHKVLGKFGLHLPSKCFCCSLSVGETIEHVFSEGQVATEVWNYFARSCGIRLSAF